MDDSALNSDARAGKSSTARSVALQSEAQNSAVQDEDSGARSDRPSAEFSDAHRAGLEDADGMLQDQHGVGSAAQPQNGDSEQEEQNGVQNEAEQELSERQGVQDAQEDAKQHFAALKTELAYACSYFSGARGYYNPFNVITAQAMSERLRPLAPTSVHQAEQLLRPPYSQQEQQSRNFAATKLQNDLEIKSLCAQEMLEILNYRTAQLDDIDFGLEAFKLLGGNENTPIAASKLTELVAICYNSFEETIDCIEDLQQHRSYVREQIEATERLRAEKSGQHYAGHKWEKEVIYEPAGKSDILDVLQMSVGCDRQEFTLEQFRALFGGIRKLEFRDYRKDIEKASGKLVIPKK